MIITMRRQSWERPLLAGVTAVLLASCTTLPPVTDKPVATALATPDSGPLVETSRGLARGRASSHSSVLLLEENKEALEWRLALIDSARSSIDIQVYLWHPGASSALLFDRLFEAADRGVRVRLLVDDFLMKGQERDVAALCREHPNFDIRIFNPKMWRGSALHKGIGFLASFNKLNRRMHNKTWTVDGCMSIVGGRNVADHYYGLDPHYNFIDFDVLVSGPVVQDVSAGFDEYWNSSSAYPGARLSPLGTAEDVQDMRRIVRTSLHNNREILASFPVKTKDWSRELSALRRAMARGRVRFVQDRAEVKEDNRNTVATLREMTRNQEQELIFITPYLIPSKAALENLGSQISGGLKVGVLVPSLGANNQALVHGHYKKHRKAILESGASLFETRPNLSPDVLKNIDVPPVTADRTCGHGKAVVGDRKRCFIGSLNLDPRAMEINTESGLFIDSEPLTKELLAYLKTLVSPENSWELKLDSKGRVIWTAGGEVLTKEPRAGFSATILSGISGLLPIQSQL